MLEYTKKKVALIKAFQETIQKIQEKGDETKEIKYAFDVIKKELVNPHTKDEVMDSLTLIFETINKNF